MDQLISLNFTYKRQKLTSKSLQLQVLKNSAEGGTLKNYSAMKWIKISEVKKEKLVDYLMKIKQGLVRVSGH